MNKTQNTLLTPAAVRSEMDGSKRRRVGPGNEVSDAEVEEFYAILRRIRMASKTIGLAQSPVAMWNPSFAPEDFEVRKDETEEGAAVKCEALEVQSGGKAPAVRRPLDLNADPEPEI